MPSHARASKAQTGRGFGGSPARHGAAAMAPPGYGIDLADSGREPGVSTRSPIYKGMAPAGPTVAIPTVQAKLTVGEADD